MLSVGRSFVYFHFSRLVSVSDKKWVGEENRWLLKFACVTVITRELRESANDVDILDIFV